MWSEGILCERRGGGGKIAGLRGRLGSKKMADDGGGRVERKGGSVEEMNGR